MNEACYSFNLQLLRSSADNAVHTLRGASFSSNAYSPHMKYAIFVIFSVWFSFAAMAEVFTCQAADGSTMFSDIPCRLEKSGPKKSGSVQVEPAPSTILCVEPETVIRDYPEEIATIKSELDGLSKALEAEIADAPHHTENPDLLYELKTEIRANYQPQIDDKLSQLVALRAMQRAEINGP
jgi:hypothetical protein